MTAPLSTARDSLERRLTVALAHLIMWERHPAGLAPDALSVASSEEPA